MDLNIKTESTVLKMTFESGVVLNLQISRPIQLTIANGSYWGGIGGNIERQADLIALFDKTHGIVVSNLTTDLDPFTKAGEYHIVMRRYVEQAQYEISLPYILYVQVTPRGTITQILVDPLSHKVRTCIDGVWSEWGEQYNYASKADVDYAIKLLKAAL